jgi:hypothetical protein
MMPGRVQIYRPGLTEAVKEDVGTVADTRALLEREIGPDRDREEIPFWRSDEGGAPCRAFRNAKGMELSLAPNRLAKYAWERAQVGSGRPPLNDTLVGTVCVVTGDVLEDI